MNATYTSKSPWLAGQKKLHIAALARSRQAISDGYFLEAVAIVEGVMTDCLETHFSRFFKRKKRLKPTLLRVLREGQGKGWRGGLSLPLAEVERWNHEKAALMPLQPSEHQLWQERYQALEPVARRGLKLALEVRREVKQLALTLDRIDELTELEDVQQAIDRVAEDLGAGQNRFSVLTATQLAELLDVDLDQSDQSFFYEYRANPDGYDYPFAENVDLLRKHIPAKRYTTLSRSADAIMADPSMSRADLTLTAKEEKLLRAEYHLAHHSGEGVTLNTQTVRSTDGVELLFESTDSEAWSPYDLSQGRSFDLGDYVPADADLVDLLM